VDHVHSHCLGPRRLAILACAAGLAVAASLAHAQESLVDTIARLKPGIVAVGTFQKTRSPPFVFRGTGFAVGDGTLIATAAHVVAEALQTENREIMAILHQVPGTRVPQGQEATAIAVDKVHDVALLRITGTRLPTLPLGDSEKVREGQGVAFTGFPLGTALGYFPVTHLGIIASLVPAAMPSANASRLDPKVIQGLKSGPFVLFQLDATTFPGHSGSPLYDTATGEVVGIVNMGFLKSIKDSAVGQPSGISFAVPIQHLQELLRAPR
jgi:S1-C subfamily serine protease